MASTQRTVKVRFDGDTSGLDKAARKGARSIAGWSDSLDKADESFKRTGDTSDKMARKTITNLDKIDRTLKNLRANVEENHQAFADTGDVELFRQISKDQSLIRKLEKVRAEVARINDDANRVKVAIDVDEDRSKRSFGRAIQGLTREAGQAGLKLGASVGAAMPGGIGRGLSTAGPEVSAAIVGGLAGVVAAAAPLLGATVSAALLGGVGAAGIGGGIALAFQDPKIKAAASSFGEHVKAGLVGAADSFKGATLGALDVLGRGFDRMRPRLTRIFDSLAPQVEGIAAGLTGAFEKALPGIETAARASGKVFDAIAESLPQLGHDIGEFFAKISAGSEGAGQAVMALVDIFGFMLDAMAPILVGLSKVFEGTNKLFGFWQKGGGDTKKSIQELKDAFKSAGDGFSETTVAVSQSANAAERGMQMATGAATQLQSVVESLNQVMQTAADKNISAAEAALSYRDALNAAKDAIDKKKKVNRGEEEALLNLARRSNALVDSLVKQGASAGQVTKSGDQLRKDFIKTAERMGYTSTQAKALADKYLAIPKNVNTKVSVNTGPVLAQVAKIQRAINDIHGKTVGIHVSGPGGSGTQISRSATGGLVRGPGTSTSDSILTRLSNNEYVIRAAAVKALGTRFLDQLNNSGPGSGTPRMAWHDYLTRAGSAPAASTPPVAAAAGPEVLELHLDLGEGIRQVVQVNLRERDRGLRRRVGAGASR